MPGTHYGRFAYSEESLAPISMVRIHLPPGACSWFVAKQNLRPQQSDMHTEVGLTDTKFIEKPGKVINKGV